MKYIGVEQTLFADRQESKAQMELYYDGSYLGIIEPGHSFYPSFDISATRAAIRSTLVEDFYVVPSGFGDDGEAVFRVRVNPLVWWMWASGPILLLGTIVALWPQRNPEPAKLRVPAGSRLKKT
jgi:cytochrome c-type biogenesis protein CcmF